MNHCLTIATCECGPGRRAARTQASDQASINSQAWRTRCPYKRQARQAFISSRLGGSSRSRPDNIAPRHRNGEAVRAGHAYVAEHFGFASRLVQVDRGHWRLPAPHQPAVGESPTAGEPLVGRPGLWLSGRTRKNLIRRSCHTAPSDPTRAPTDPSPVLRVSTSDHRSD